MITNKIKWRNSDITDSEFVTLSEKYFERQIWDLHTAICLWAKLDPNKKNALSGDSILGDQGSISKEDEMINRYYKLSLVSIQCADDGVAKHYGIVRLPALACPDNPKTAKEVTLNPRHFVSWLEQKYPDNQPHMVAAESAYQRRKASKKVKRDTWGNPRENKEKHRNFAHNEFLAMVAENDIDLSKKGIVQPLAVQLHYRLKEKVTNPYKPHTLRDSALIPTWISQYLLRR